MQAADDGSKEAHGTHSQCEVCGATAIDHNSDRPRCGECEEKTQCYDCGRWKHWRDPCENCVPGYESEGFPESLPESLPADTSSSRWKAGVVFLSLGLPMLGIAGVFVLEGEHSPYRVMSILAVLPALVGFGFVVAGGTLMGTAPRKK
jgi:hypothetical protein